MTYKQWTTGDVLTASDQNALSDQVVNRFADATARDAAITSPTDGQMCFLTGSSALQYHDGSSWTSIDLAGDITGITTAAASGLAGGTTTGNATLTFSPGGLTAAQSFGSDGAGVDVTLHSDTAGDYLLWDSSEEKLVLEGTNGATVLDVSDGNVVIGDGTLTVGSDGAGEDVTFHSGTAGDSFLWDSSEEKLILEGTNSATVLDITDGNVSIGDGTLAVSGTVTVGTDGAGSDVTFNSGTSGDLMLWDASDKALEFTDAKITMGDNLIETPEFIDYAETVNAIGSTGGGTQALDIALGNVQTATVDTSTNTFTFDNPSATGKACSFTLILTNGGSQTVTWPGTVDWAGGTAPTLTSSGIDILTFMTIDAGTIWYGFLAGADMK